MAIQKKTLIPIVESVVEATILALEGRGLLKATTEGIGKAKGKSSALEKTEALLDIYNDLKAYVVERERDIANIRKYGVPTTLEDVLEYAHTGRMPKIVQDDELVEAAVRRIEMQMVGVVQAISLVERGLDRVRNDQYYRILEMRYIEGKTQGEIAEEIGCTQQNVSYVLNRLTKLLAIRLFPDEVVAELMD